MTDLRRAAEMASKRLERSESELHKARAELSQALSQTEQECIYPECETGIGCDGPCNEKPVDETAQSKQKPAVYKCPRCATSMDVDLNAKPVDTVNTSQERVDETAKRKHEPVAWHEPGAYGNVTTHKDWALANGWEPLYKENT